MTADLLANAERAAGDKPAASPERVDPHAGYWIGSAGAEVARWRERALRAERLVEGLRSALARYRMRP